jgi:hypothetical protein
LRIAHLLWSPRVPVLAPPPVATPHGPQSEGGP